MQSTSWWRRTPRSARRIAGLGIGTTLGAINGLGTACMETVLTAVEAAHLTLGSLRARQPMRAVRAVLSGVGEVLTAAISPFCSNIAVGVRAGVELGRQMTEESGSQFELMVGGGNNLEFKSRIGNEIVTGGVVRSGFHSLYPEIQYTTIKVDKSQVQTTTRRIDRPARYDSRAGRGDSRA